MSCYAMSMPPPWAWGGQQASGPPSLNDISTWIRGLEDLKKMLKDDHGHKKDDDKKKKPELSAFSLMAFMLLISPITGPTMYYFFQMSLGLIHK